MTRTDGTGSDAVAAFEQARHEFRRSRRSQTMLFIVLFAASLAASAYVGEVRIDKFVEGVPGLFSYIAGTLPDIHRGRVLADVGDWYWGIGRWLGYLLDTLVMAFVGTLLGAVGALMLCFPASRNLVRGRSIYFLCRRVMEFARSIPDLVLAMIFVFAFGLGPLPGVLALAVHTAGALGKLFAEVNENVDLKPLDGVRAAGGNWLQVIRFAVIPQVLPNFLSYALLRFEINVRAASVIGFVGAGGIGQELLYVVRQFIYADVSAIVLLLIAAVAIIDIGCEMLRHRVIGREHLL
jgi:phosphonate transport system permease protein